MTRDILAAAGVGLAALIPRIWIVSALSPGLVADMLDYFDRARHLFELADGGQGPGVTDRGRATCAARHDLPIARESQRPGSNVATDEPRGAERPAGGRVEAPKRRAIRWEKDRGEQRAPIGGQAQGFDGPTIHRG